MRRFRGTGMKTCAWACAALGIGLLVGPRAASAGEYLYLFEADDYQSADWTLKNAAAWNDTDWDHIRLTPSAINKTGAAWLNARQIVPTNNWTFFMRGRTTDRDVAGGGADMMSMLLQTAGPNAAANAAGVGYGRYLRIGLDSYYNTGDAYNPNTLKLITNGVLVASLNLDSALELNNYFNGSGQIPGLRSRQLG